MRRKDRRGQALILFVVVLGVFLFGALGLAVDASMLYGNRQKAQAAADAAAQAGATSILGGTYTPANSGAAFNCAGTAPSPCWYASNNGFLTAADIVNVSFPTSVAGVTLSTHFTPAAVTVKITRTVPTTFMRVLGVSSGSVTARATAAITTIPSAAPIVVLHPTMSGALSSSGSTTIQIIGGPQVGIQVNSNSTTAVSPATVDLSAGGPLGTGSDFAVVGGPTVAPGGINFGTAPGHYLQPALPLNDPLAFVSPPADPGGSTPATGSCGTGCTLYYPGKYNGDLSAPHGTVQFAPGVYYVVNGNFALKNTVATMCTTCATDPSTGSGMLVYHTGSGKFDLGTNIDGTSLLGAGISASNPLAAASAPYYGILFFQDRNADAMDHHIGQGNGCFDLIGTIYLTNLLATMKADPSHYQSIRYNGGPCSTTAKQGEVITDAISMVGGSLLKMALPPAASFQLDQVALVK